MDIPKLLNLSKNTVKEASSLLEQILLKDKKNIVSTLGKDVKLEADILLDQLICKNLLENSPYPVLSEEQGFQKNSKEDQEYLWIVDPLDGTSNYSRDFPICCISIALIHENEITLGVINDFNRGSLYEGSIDSKAKLNGADIFVSSIDDKSKATLATGLPAKGNFNKESMSELSNELVSWKKVRMIGSAAMAACYVASGKAETYKENGIFLWDVAAGAAIVGAAGGKVSLKNIQSDFRVDAKFSNNTIEQ